MAKAIAGFFRTQSEGEQAKAALSQAGFLQNEVSYVAGDTRPTDTPKIGPSLREAGTESEAGTDAFVGAVVGLAAGAVALALPGLGALIAAGPVAGAIGGMTAGAAVGGLYGLIKDHGISEEEAEFYEEGVRRGGALIIVHGVDGDREKTARKVMDDAGAIEVEKLADEWRSTGWKGPRPQALRTR